MDEEHQGISDAHVGRLQHGAIGIDLLTTHGIGLCTGNDTSLLLRIIGPQSSHKARLSPCNLCGHLALEFALASSTFSSFAFTFAFSFAFTFAFTFLSFGTFTWLLLFGFGFFAILLGFFFTFLLWFILFITF